MDNNSLQSLKRSQKIFDTAKKKKRVCMCDGCQSTAINSHLLQRHGILNHIVENGHLYEVSNSDVFSWDKAPSPLKFKMVGLQQVVSLSLFCQKHDTNMFADIEKKEIDFDDYRSQLLFSLRVAYAEKRKKEINVETSDAILKTITPMPWLGPLDPFYTHILFKKGSSLGEQMMGRMVTEIENELKEPNGNFVFRHYTYPKIKVCASSVFTYDKHPHDGSGINKAQNNGIWDYGYIHVIPQSDSTEILIGHNKNHVNAELLAYIDSWANLDNNHLGMKLTDLFGCRIETWALSPSLYKSLDKALINKFIKYVGEHSMDYSIGQSVPFNLFEGLI